MRDRLGKPYVPYKDVLERTDNTEYFCYNDLVSHAMYPDVHRDFMTHIGKYSDTSIIPTPQFFSKMSVGETVNLTHMGTRNVTVKLVAIGHQDEDGNRRVFFEVNGAQNSFDVQDRTEEMEGGKSKRVQNEKADPANEGHIGCSMKGLIVDVLKSEGDIIEEGEPIAVLSAMKMESVVSAPIAGRLTKVIAKMGDALDSGDLIAIITPADSE
jgi:pyruvate carboxylase